MASIRKDALPVTEALLRALPKTDLHCHLDGSLRLRTLLELGEQQGMPLPAGTEEGLAQALHMGQVRKSLEAYLLAFDVTLSVLQTAEALERAAYELGMDAAEENVRWLEVRYSPILHQQRGLKPTAIVDAVLDGLRRAERESNIKTGVILCGIRHLPPRESLRLAELAVAYKERGVVGFDLAGAEVGFPAKEHEQAFHLLHENNVHCTVHAGEAAGPESISQAIHDLGAHRIGHGVRLREDEDLLQYVHAHRIPLECCPSSNLQTGAVASWESHPLKSYLGRGLQVTLNTDNRLLSDTTVTKELLVAHRHMGLSLPELLTLLVSGFNSAFLPLQEKQDLLVQARRETAEVIACFERASQEA